MQNGAEIVCKNSVQIVLQKLHFLCIKKGVVKWCKWTLYVCFLARVNKQTNEQTNKTPIGVREKVDRKDEEEEENFEVTFVPVFGWRKNEVPLSFFIDEQKVFQR